MFDPENIYDDYDFDEEYEDIYRNPYWKPSVHGDHRRQSFFDLRPEEREEFINYLLDGLDDGDLDDFDLGFEP